MEYSKEITHQFLIKYRELDALKENNSSKYQYLLSLYRSELELFRHIRNDLSHDQIAGEYPYIVSSACLDLLNEILKKVNEKAYRHAIKGKHLLVVKENTPIRKVLQLMSKYNYSYIPVVDEKNVVIGVISNDSIIDLMYKNLKVTSNPIVKDFIDVFSIDNNENAFFIFIKRNMYMYELKEIFDSYNHENRKLGIVFITGNGSHKEQLLGILTPWEILKNQE